MPVVLDVQEVLRLIDKLEGKGSGLFQLAAKLQYGSGLRVSELASLRIKDVDLARRTITVRAGKGDRDRVTVLPEGLVDELSRQIATARILYDSDRAAGRPGVALPGNGGLERKMPKAGVRWEWFWLFPVEIYTHVAKGVGHSGIRSPLDRL